MNLKILNPVILIERGLALIGVGGFYLYLHDSAAQKENSLKIEGRYRLRPNINKITLKSSVIAEVKFSFFPPEGSTPPPNTSRR